ncbi:cyclic nucleotide-binding protein [Sorangium cellulosum]|uniref:Cyclic nucleotide-binding protein n=1 Tax=Sorangium cellulosum TaxID=56 RepID=A0A150R5W1_SORCE|nr:cyclic nucleotide-binding protein [Sorangium cellulosum]KYF95592.1 cyclic nucleotide-binding protein [Sorangium cellulosum]KYG01740.1 cyclic nucleotide-binding protein [Sorangium cellulosum]
MKAEELLPALGAHPFLEGLPAAHVARLAGGASAQSFPEGAFLLREGGEADMLYLLTQGRVTLEIHRPGRGPVQVESLLGGDILGLHWLFPPRRWVLDARAVTQVRAIGLDAAHVRACSDADPALGYAVSLRLLRQLYARLERVRLQRLDVYRAEP